MRDQHPMPRLQNDSTPPDPSGGRLNQRGQNDLFGMRWTTSGTDGGAPPSCVYVGLDNPKAERKGSCTGCGADPADIAESGPGQICLMCGFEF